MKLNQLTNLGMHLNSIVLKDRDPNLLSLSFRANEMQEEAGELGGVVKKIERLRLGIPGSKPEHQSMEVLRKKANEEFGDLLLTIGLLADAMEINLEYALKFKVEELLDRYENLGMLEGSLYATRGIREITSNSIFR
jgi:NTP pyrophosphatase (non-canonical NTP hydrolase)